MNRSRFISVLLLALSISGGYAKTSKTSKASAKGHTVNVADFGAYPDDGINDFEPLRKATDYCRSHPGTTLRFLPGIYDIIDSTALRIEREAICGAYGENVQGVLFRPDGPYVKALDLTDCKQTVVDAPGATLLLHGWYEAICLDNTKGVTIDGISLRYNRHPNTVGRIVNSTPTYFDMWIDREKYPMIDSIVTGRTHFYDHIRNRLYTGWGTKKELISPDIIRIHSKRNPPVGDFCILRHGGHYRPAVMIREASDIILHGVKIHSQPGMGVVGHRSSNITLDNLQVVPEPGDVISTNTDATHFTSCSGRLDIINSFFKGQGDDCTNIHNYYSKIYPLAPDMAELRVENADLHALALDPPERGDSMLIIDRNNMQEIARLRVKDVATSEKDWKTIVTFDRPVFAVNSTNSLNSSSPDSSSSSPEVVTIDPEKYVITNLTRFPVVTIAGNTVNSHLARAFLVKSPNVIIRGNNITGSTQTAIKLGAELGWNESGPVDNVLIEDNYISGCGYDASEKTPSCITLSTEASQTPPFVNRNITIRNNIFDTDHPVAILLKDGSDITLSNNLFPQTLYPNISQTVKSNNPSDCPMPKESAVPVTIENCTNVTLK